VKQVMAAGGASPYSLLLSFLPSSGRMEGELRVFFHVPPT